MYTGLPSVNAVKAASSAGDSLMPSDCLFAIASYIAGVTSLSVILLAGRDWAWPKKV